MVTVYITAPPTEAEHIARTLVDERLAACVNRVACDSVYRWEGAIHQDEEVLLLAKTTDDRYDELKERIVDVHPYDVPCVERFDEADAFVPFARWRDDAVRSDG